ncbi:MAG TPA: prephenate dehydrogenase/arogenate dehydrogenase family protein [Candidatus Acidoferrum sp.]|jgi:prephenate dehydrogenase
MASPGHLLTRATILGTGLIGGSFALALRKYAPDMYIRGWDHAQVAGEAKSRLALDEVLSGNLAAALRDADLVYAALPIGATLDLLAEIARHAPSHALITDACSTKLRIVQKAGELFSESLGPIFLGGHPMAGREVGGLANADADLFRGAAYVLVGDAVEPRDSRVAAFLKIIEKMGARPLWLGAQQHDYAVGLVSHLPQLAAVALGTFLYDHLDENGLPITVAGSGLRDSLRLAGSPYGTWRDIVLTNREVLSAALDLFARRLDEMREKLASRELEADFDRANDLYKMLRSM